MNPSPGRLWIARPVYPQIDTSAVGLPFHTLSARKISLSSAHSCGSAISTLSRVPSKTTEAASTRANRPMRFQSTQTAAAGPARHQRSTSPTAARSRRRIRQGSHDLCACRNARLAPLPSSARTTDSSASAATRMLAGRCRAAAPPQPGSGGGRRPRRLARPVTTLAFTGRDRRRGFVAVLCWARAGDDGHARTKTRPEREGASTTGNRLGRPARGLTAPTSPVALSQVRRTPG